MYRAQVLPALLLSLLAGCGTAEQAQPRQTPTLAASPTAGVDPSSAPELAIDATAARPFCQLASQTAAPGSWVKLSAFNLPADWRLSINLDGFDMAARSDGNGSLSTKFAVPQDQPWGLYRVSVDPEGSFDRARCSLWIWPEPDPPALSPVTEERLSSALECNRRGVVRLSPDRRWAVIDCAVYAVTLLRLDERSEWTLSSESLVGSHTDHFIDVFHWSGDGSYAYVGANPHRDGFWEPFHQAAALFQINLTTGEIKAVLKGAYYSFAFSPHDRLLAYMETANSPIVLRVRDLKTGAEQATQFDAKYNTGGGYVWSPDGLNLIFSIAQYDQINFAFVTSSIAWWDGSQGRTIRILEGYEEVLVPVEWDGREQIVVGLLYDEDKRFRLDLVSGELEPISP